ncbi:DUF2235 domain-containing protein [Bradyrhizobium diazoefficiens]|nr:DUF2235 domain-containing protein [Bradyrhizobium diazoefficiens]MBR0849626.1 DUF2235 domain-containing protein [Bradyrhizobium diazoefficiens]
MARWLVVCIDGTWNSPAEQAKCFRAPTNVQRISELLVNDETQRVFYLPGIGTGRATDRFLGGVWGTGTTRRIRDGYRILCENWQPDDQIALVGFSRGAFAVRWITGIIANVGLLRREHLELVDRAIAMGTRPTRGWLVNIESIQRDKFVKDYCHDPRAIWAIWFVGVFDTVIRYGPLLAVGRRIIQAVRRRHIGLRDNRAPHMIRYIAHALALDESRVAFAPWRYEEDPELVSVNRIEVWFAGSHSDVGGGYVDSRSSESALRWMADRARRVGLRFKEMPVVGERSYCAPLHESRTGMWCYLPSAGRIVKDGDRIHSSVEHRMQATGYRPAAALPAVVKNAD